MRLQPSKGERGQLGPGPVEQQGPGGLGLMAMPCKASGFPLSDLQVIARQEEAQDLT